MGKKCLEREAISAFNPSAHLLKLIVRYFGRAKDLPGVKELFNKGGGYLSVGMGKTADEQQQLLPRSRHEMLLSRSLEIKAQNTMETMMSWMENC